MAYSALTFLVDLGIYDPAFLSLLTQEEKERERRYKTVISRQRFVLSRTILKKILSEILDEDKNAEVILFKNQQGRIMVNGRPDIYISLSYYGTCIAITLGKGKLGSDIEGVRPILDKKITASPLFSCYPCAQDNEHIRQVIHLWTLVESYAKLYDKNPYPLLDSCQPFCNASFISYSLDQQMIFSLAFREENVTSILVWLDTGA